MAWYSYIRKSEHASGAANEPRDASDPSMPSNTLAAPGLQTELPATIQAAAILPGEGNIKPDSPMPAGYTADAGEFSPNEMHSPAHRPVAHRKSGGVALALGGGVAKGWAHIGALRAVDEVGLPVTMIAGTSIGALVGGAYLAGVLDELETFARSLTKSNVVRYLDFTLRGSGLISGARLARRMDDHMADIAIESLNRSFVAVATDIRTGHEVWLSDGPISPAIRASYALPGVFTPVVLGGRQLVDGALVNPVPVSVCRAFEPDMVIAVNLASASFGKGTVIRPSHYSHIDQALAEDKKSQAASWFSFMQSQEKPSARENRLGVTSVMVEAFNIIQDRIARARLAGDPPDFTIRPRLGNIGLIDFHKADEAIKLGYDEMMMRLRELEDQGILDRIA